MEKQALRWGQRFCTILRSILILPLCLQFRFALTCYQWLDNLLLNQTQKVFSRIFIYYFESYLYNILWLDNLKVAVGKVLVIFHSHMKHSKHQKEETELTVVRACGFIVFWYLNMYICKSITFPFLFVLQYKIIFVCTIK